MDEGEEHIEVVKRGFQAIEHGDYDQLRPHLAEDAIWSGGPGPVPAIEGADEVIAEMKKWDEIGGTMEIESAEYFGDEHKVVSLQHVRLTRDGRTLETDNVQVVEFRNDKVSKMTVFMSEPEKVAAFFA